MVPNAQQAGNTTSLKRPGTLDPGGPVPRSVLYLNFLITSPFVFSL